MANPLSLGLFLFSRPFWFRADCSRLPTQYMSPLKITQRDNLTRSRYNFKDRNRAGTPLAADRTDKT